LWRIARYARYAAEPLRVRIEYEGLNGMTEGVEARETLERLQELNLEVSEEIDAY
jgi:hypothetical protein